MWQDWLLIARFNRGDGDAFRRIYLDHRSALLKVAGSLLFDKGMAEDVLHDVFLGFARQAGSFQLQGRLRAYLAICVANRARDLNRKAARPVDPAVEATTEPSHPLMERERTARLDEALAALPFEQREVLVLHLQQNLRFREIAQLKALSTNTVASRYRYALDKLRSSLDGEL